jgi:hypothetical protein
MQCRVVWYVNTNISGDKYSPIFAGETDFSFINPEDGSSIFFYVDIYLLTTQQQIPQKGDVYS